MCLSVNKAYENCCESMNKVLEARHEQQRKLNIVEEKKENVDNAAAAELVVSEEKVFISDHLALMTQMTRKFFIKCKLAAGKMQESTFYRILTRTTQPAHVASMIIVLLISFSIFEHKHEQNTAQRNLSPLTTFFYLGSFAAHFGAQIWMTFVSGLALYFSLPRHTFGMCQEVLFPKYFLINTLFSTVTVITFAKINVNFNDSREMSQLAILSLCLIIEMIIYFYLTPSLLRYMRLKYQYEKTLGNGDEVGYQKTLPAFNCEEYKKVHKKFRRVHMMCAMGNIVAICCTFTHLYYIASKISMV